MKMLQELLHSESGKQGTDVDVNFRAADFND